MGEKEGSGWGLIMNNILLQLQQCVVHRPPYRIIHFKSSSYSKTVKHPIPSI